MNRFDRFPVIDKQSNWSYDRTLSHIAIWDIAVRHERRLLDHSIASAASRNRFTANVSMRVLKLSYFVPMKLLPKGLPSPDDHFTRSHRGGLRRIPRDACFFSLANGGGLQHPSGHTGTLIGPDLHCYCDSALLAATQEW